jgi:lysozyme
MVTATTEVVALDIEKIAAQLKRDEGFRQFPYGDARGVLTVGYGFNLASDGLNEQESSVVLHIRAWNRYVELLTTLPWVHKLDDARQGVLLNMAYNLGVAGLLEFKRTLELVQAGAYTLAADEMRKSKWADEVPRRAHRLLVQMESGVWQ